MALGSDRRKVVAIDGRLLAYRRGGIPRYVRGLISHLPAAAPDLDFRLIVNRPGEQLAIPVERVRTPPHHRLERLSLGVELSLRRPALVHSPDFIPPRMAGIPRVVTVHDLSFLDRLEDLSIDSAHYYSQLPRAIACACRVITVSEATRARVVRELSVSAARVTTVYNGVDDRFFAPPDEPADLVLAHELGRQATDLLLAERPVLLAVGTVEPRKRHALLAEATAILADARRDAPPLLVVVGEPGWRANETEAAIATLARRGLALRLPKVSDDALHALYRTAALLAMPSRDEGFGLPAAEAMAAGLPVVAADRGALPEIVGDVGLLVAADDAEAWADAIGALLDDPARRAALAGRGVARAGRFRWTAAAERTAAVYREVLGV